MMRTWLPLLLPALSLALVIGCAAPGEDEDTIAAESDLTAGAASSQSRDQVVDQARANRLVGEQATGYLGLVDEAEITGDAQAPRDLSARVQHINIQRRALYTESAERTRVTVQMVAETSACVLLRDRVKVGEAYRSEHERWAVHTASEPVEIPSFCARR